jgi:cytochrome c
MWALRAGFALILGVLFPQWETLSHASALISASPVGNAPPLRTLNLKYGVADLQRPLAEGIHPTMPRFWLTPGEIEDVMAYLKTLR